MLPHGAALHYQSLLIIRRDAGVRTARNIFSGFRGWPKTLSDFAFWEARLAVIWRRPIRPVEDDPLGHAVLIIYITTSVVRLASKRPTTWSPEKTLRPL
jgi:hypothetical protein